MQIIVLCLCKVTIRISIILPMYNKLNQSDDDDE